MGQTQFGIERRSADKLSACRSNRPKEMAQQPWRKSNVLQVETTIAETVVPMECVDFPAKTTPVMMEHHHVGHVFDGDTQQECAHQIIGVFCRAQGASHAKPLVETTDLDGYAMAKRLVELHRAALERELKKPKKR
ncbi:hypothetical protein G6N73_31755 [Mesorhizobium camelthorni]|uniref:Uncharacterized protein n=1 Tax=Allomesorhizobium camelthorni TaxID=475069 RepID=A0A6G4WL71_9HYPH|nr:hypothetical protein [Mesorhizobium camelthorni]